MSGRRLISILMITWMTICLTGCSFLLPKTTQKTKSVWQSFDEAKKSFDQVTPGQTSLKELYKMGFNPYKSTNMTIKNFISVRDRFDPKQSGNHLPGQIRQCLEMLDSCYSINLEVGGSKSRRVGNFLLDMTSFRRQTVASSWRFEATFIISNQKVVYKVWRGFPKKEVYSDKVKPLGPLQNIVDYVPVIEL